MGGGSYNFAERSVRATTSYAGKSANQIFEQNEKRKIHESMSPLGITVREARDSAEHPNSVPIILNLDLTGSMGAIPMHLVQEGLPKIMAGIIQAGVPDPQLLFIGIGDHEVDKYPLQVGQFESADLELDTWLTRTYLEGGGGGNSGESYLLAWYFAAFHTATDAWDKRKQKGFLFTIGDEPTLKNLPANAVKTLIGNTQQHGYTAEQLLELAQQRWNVYHLHITQTGTGRQLPVQNGWKELLGQNAIMVDNYEDVPSIVSKIVNDHSEKNSFNSVNPPAAAKPAEEEML